MIAGTHDALHDQSQPHSEEESKVLGDPHLLLHHLLSLYSHVVYQLSTNQWNHFKKLRHWTAGPILHEQQHRNTDYLELCIMYTWKSLWLLLPSVDQQQEQNSQRHISNVAEDVVERADKTPGVSTVEVVVADVQVSSYIQYL